MTGLTQFEDGHFGITHDYYSLYLWCDWCDAQRPGSEDPVPVAAFYGDPEPLARIIEAGRVHDITQHAEPIGDVNR